MKRLLRPGVLLALAVTAATLWTYRWAVAVRFYAWKLRSDDVATQVAGAQGLARAGAAGAPALIELLKDSHRVRLEASRVAVVALGEQREARAFDVILHPVEENSDARGVPFSAERATALEHFDDPRALAPLLRSYFAPRSADEHCPPAVLSAIRAIGGHHPVVLFEAIEALLDDHPELGCEIDKRRELASLATGGLERTKLAWLDERAREGDEASFVPRKNCRPRGGLFSAFEAGHAHPVDGSAALLISPTLVVTTWDGSVERLPADQYMIGQNDTPAVEAFAFGRLVQLYGHEWRSRRMTPLEKRSAERLKAGIPDAREIVLEAHRSTALALVKGTDGHWKRLVIGLYSGDVLSSTSPVINRPCPPIADYIRTEKPPLTWSEVYRTLVADCRNGRPASYDRCSEDAEYYRVTSNDALVDSRYDDKSQLLVGRWTKAGCWGNYPSLSGRRCTHYVCRDHELRVERPETAKATPCKCEPGDPLCSCR